MPAEQCTGAVQEVLAPDARVVPAVAHFLDQPDHARDVVDGNVHGLTAWRSMFGLTSPLFSRMVAGYRHRHFEILVAAHFPYHTPHVNPASGVNWQ